MAPVRLTPLHELHAAKGAEFLELWGWLWLVTFGDEQRESAAIAGDVGMTDVSQIVKWELEGPDAVAVADSLHSNDIGASLPGRVRYGAFLDESGRMLDDGCVAVLGPQLCWLMTNVDSMAEHFRQIASSYDVSLRNITEDYAVISLQGPRSFEFLRPFVDAPLESLDFFSIFPNRVGVGGAETWVSRTGFSSQLGFEIFVPRHDAPGLWSAFESAGAVPYGANAVNVQRVEAGIVIHGVDYEPSVSTPYDVSFDRLVALNKAGNLQGRESLRAISQDPPQRLVTLRLDDDAELPAAAVSVIKDENVVGTLTSAALSPTFGPIGLARLQSAWVETGEVRVEGEGVSQRARIERAPIDDTRRRWRALNDNG